MIAGLAWVPPGAANPTLIEKELSVNEIEEMEKMDAQGLIGETIDEEWEDTDSSGDEKNGDQMDDEDEPSKEVTVKKKKKDHSVLTSELKDVIDTYGLDDYDDEEEGPSLHDRVLDPSISNMLYYKRGENDPHFVDSDEDDVDDAADAVLKPSDACIAMARVEDENAMIEVQVYNEDTATVHVRNDIQIPSVPLAVDWNDLNPLGGDVAGNFLAMSSFMPHIEIWDLDVKEPVEPVAVLGVAENVEDMMFRQLKKKKKGAAPVVDPLGPHTDAVLSIHWNKVFKTALASGSADKTVKVWDVTKQKVVQTFDHHTAPVQAVKWHPTKASSLLTGSFDRTASYLDMRTPKDILKYQVMSDVENLAWNPTVEDQFFVSNDTGTVFCFDTRKNKPLYTFDAHSTSTTSLSFSPKVAGLLITTSLDKSAKVWDISGPSPTAVLSRSFNAVGGIMTSSFHPTNPYTVALGGEQGMLAVWQLWDEASVAHHFKDRLCLGPLPDINDVSMEELANAKFEEDEDSTLELDEAEAQAVLAKKKLQKKKNKKVRGKKK